MGGDSRRDVDAARRELHPDIEAVPFGADIERKSYRGIEAVVRW